MKISEVIGQLDDEPIIVSLIRQRLLKGEHVARYYKSGATVKPMWIQSVSAAAGHADTDASWVFTVVKNRSTDYLSYTQHDLDNRMELIPGKIKKTWELRKRPARVSESLGEQVMEFTDYLEKYCPLDDDAQDLLTAFAHRLFKAGWLFDLNTSGSMFSFRVDAPYAPAEYSLSLPYHHWAGGPASEWEIVELRYHHRHGGASNDVRWHNKKFNIKSLAATTPEAMMAKAKRAAHEGA